MTNQRLIKVIKRVERQRPEPEAASSTDTESSAHNKARALATTVKGWVSEFQQTRLLRRQEIEERLGWSQGVGDRPIQEAEALSERRRVS